MTLATKPRWDKYNGYVGNFRAPLNADATDIQKNAVLAVGVNSSGAVVVGASQTGISGLVIFPVGLDYISGALLPGPYAGDIVDVGKHGEIVNFVPSVETNSFAVHVTVGSGNITLTVNGQVSGNIAYNAIASAVKTGIVAVDDTMLAADVTVAGSTPDYVVILPAGKTLTAGTGATVTPVSTTPTAGTKYYGHADGSVSSVQGTDGVYVGHTVEASRLIVNVIEDAGAILIADINASGTASSTTYLRGDGSWNTPIDT